MIPFFVSNVLIATNIFVFPTSTYCGPDNILYDRPQVQTQSLVTNDFTQDAHRDIGIFIPNFIWPVDNSIITDRFGSWRKDTQSYHMGIDLTPGEGTEVRAATDGIVTKVEYGTDSYGFMVKIYDNYQYSTVYAHLIAGSFEQYGISVGTKVTQGQVIGLVGNTGRSSGPHLHFEIQDEDVQVDPEPIMAKYATG
jgi:murein DD-endopeptidase MepM/ murein hydrolase activator NlpD